jgi:hypothetical protein
MRFLRLIAIWRNKARLAAAALCSSRAASCALGFACLVAGGVHAHATGADALPLTVSTQSGPVRGAGAEIVAFKGIPYATPPTRKLERAA